MAKARLRRIPPRAEHVLRYVNDVLVRNLRAGETETVVYLPDIVDRAFMIVNETATLEVQDFVAGTELVEEQ